MPAAEYELFAGYLCEILAVLCGILIALCAAYNYFLILCGGIVRYNFKSDRSVLGEILLDSLRRALRLFISLRNYYYISVRPAPGNGLVIYYGSRAAGIAVTRIGRYGTVGMIPIIGIRACYVIRQIAAAVCAQGAVRRNIRALIGRIRRIRGNGISARILRGARFF